MSNVSKEEFDAIFDRLTPAQKLEHERNILIWGNSYLKTYEDGRVKVLSPQEFMKMPKMEELP